jgi:hypothetical protein
MGSGMYDSRTGHVNEEKCKWIYLGLKGRFVLSRHECSSAAFPKLFQVGTTFISQNVLQTTLLLSPLKANCLRFSTIVCDTQFTLILFFLSFLD